MLTKLLLKFAKEFKEEKICNHSNFFQVRDLFQDLNKDYSIFVCFVSLFFKHAADENGQKGK